MNRGDTAYLMLNYTFNGEPLVQGAYQEIELQINPQNGSTGVKKLLSKNEIQWGSLTYEEGGMEKTFTGYYVSLSQEDTFSLSNGTNRVQLRVMADDEVGSSQVSTVKLGQVLSNKVLEVHDDSSE